MALQCATAAAHQASAATLGETTLKLLQKLAVALALASAGLLAATAARAQDGVSKTTIVIGQSVALTGPAALLALPFHQGARMYF